MKKISEKARKKLIISIIVLLAVLFIVLFNYHFGEKDKNGLASLFGLFEDDDQQGIDTLNNVSNQTGVEIPDKDNTNDIFGIPTPIVILWVAVIFLLIILLILIGNYI